MKIISAREMPRRSRRFLMPYALSIPGLVTSIDVAPPMRTENSGRVLSRTALIAVRLVKSGSHLSFSARGACWPRADSVIWLPRSSMTSPQTWAALEPVSSRAPRSALTILPFSSAVRSSE